MGLLRFDVNFNLTSGLESITLMDRDGGRKKLKFRPRRIVQERLLHPSEPSISPALP